MNALTIYRRETFWEIAGGGIFDTLDAALIGSGRLVGLLKAPTQIDLAHCDPVTLEFDPSAKSFVIGWYRDGELIRETDL